MNTEVKRVLDNMERHRPYRVVFYGFLLAAGTVLYSDPWSSLEKVADLVRYGWGGFLITGGLATLLGTFLDRWLIELQGDILLGSAIAGLIFVLISGNGSTGSVVVACLLAALLTAVVSRTAGLWRLANASGRIAKKRREG